MLLRSATIADAVPIAALHAQSWRHAYRGALTAKYLSGPIDEDRLSVWTQRLETPEPTQFVVVAEKESRLCGFACAFANHHPEWGACLDNIHVTLTRQRRGLGRELMSAVFRWWSTIQPVTPLYLWVFQSNERAQLFYRALGGKVVGSDVWNPPGGGSIPRYRFSWAEPADAVALASARMIVRPGDRGC